MATNSMVSAVESISAAAVDDDNASANGAIVMIMQLNAVERSRRAEAGPPPLVRMRRTVINGTARRLSNVNYTDVALGTSSATNKMIRLLATLRLQPSRVKLL